MIIPTTQQMAIFGTHEIAWEYKTFDNEHLCYVIRHQQNGKKSFKPITFQNGEWVKRYFVNKEGETLKERPLYNLHLLKLHPEKPILLVEGEKTADAASEYFPEYNVLSWMGGTGQAKNVILRHLKNKTIYLLPDNDEPGYKAMELLKSRLEDSNKVYLINIKSLPLSKGWDLADLEDGEIDLADVKLLFQDSSLLKFQSVDPETFPFKTEKGRAINTYENIEHLLNFYRIIPRFNELRKEIEADIPHKNFTKANEAKLLLSEITSLCIKNNVPRIDIPSWLMMIADKNSYNPVWEYITSKPWDGICRKVEFFNTIETDDQKHRDFILERWMRGAVATGISKNGLAHHGVLTLLGETGNGKSAWIKKLVPEELNLLMGDYIFNPHNIDDRISATKFWITELSEVAGTVSRADHNALKGFLTCKVDVYRCPYDRANTEAPRKTAFAATVNDTQFLRDDSGNRRWWVIETKNVNYEHTLNMQQVWAQFKHEYDNGEIYYLNRDEIQQLHTVNEQYRPETSIYESIMERYCWNEPERNHYASATQVLFDCGISHAGGNNAIIKEANRALQKITEGKALKINGLFKYKIPRINNYYQKQGQ